MKGVVKIKGITIGEGIPKVCVPIVGRTKEELLRMAEEVKKSSPDLVEWRADWLENANGIEQVLELASCLRNCLGEVPLLFTFRTKQEGGEREITKEAYCKLNQAVAASGLVDLVDVEFSLGGEVFDEIKTAARKAGVYLVASNHEFHKTPKKEEIIRRLCKMQDMGADILKIAVMPTSKRDVLELLLATEEMVRVHAERPVVTMSMAGMGAISRVSGEFFGSAITFGAVGKASAPGQLEADKLQMILQALHESL